jgi:PAS domain S-box-containing protein
VESARDVPPPGGIDVSDFAVLVVDDDGDMRALLRVVLEQEGFDVLEAATGAEAINEFNSTRVGLIVLDVKLLGESGIDVLAQLRALDAEVPVIFVTGEGTEDDRVLGLLSGADDYVVKPFSIREMAARALAVARRMRPALDANGHGAATPSAASGVETSLEASVVIIDTKVVHATRAALELVGARPEELIGRDVFEFVAEQSIAATVARQTSARQGRWPRPELITIRRRDGHEVLVELASTPVVWEGTPASQVTMWEQANDTALLRELATGVRTNVPEAVIISDLELRIQSFNPAAEMLYGWAEMDVIGRHVDDVLPWAGDDNERVKARSALEREGRWYGEARHRRRDGREMHTLASTSYLRDRRGRTVGIVSVNRTVDQGTTSTGHIAESDHTLERDIRRGLARDEFVVHFQPMVRLDDAVPVGVEALVRWQHPERGLLLPAAFMHIAEISGVITELGSVVLDKACRRVAEWRRDGHDIDLAVNLSGRQLADDGLPGLLADVVTATGLPADKLWLEVTETSLVEDLDTATDVLRRIDELGAKISIDDFGTGWASLTYLHNFPVHALKIDRTFVEHLGENERSTAIAASIVSLGLELGIEVVAEGIETREQRDHLRSLGCLFGQGYLFGGPVTGDAFSFRSPN